MDPSLTLILKTLSALADVGLQVKEIEASPWAYGLLVQQLHGFGEPVHFDYTWSPGDLGLMTLNHYGQSVRITAKPPLKLTLDLPPKVPVPGE